ncbi:hypothetical protein BH23PLA1_BH23PLA1_15880 [soil metagenome]
MNSLQDAWNWYTASRKMLRLVDRLGERYWDHLDWVGPMGRDERLEFESIQLKDGAASALNPLDDLAVLVLFSVFELIVRDRVRSDIESEVQNLHHPTLLHAVEDVKDQIDHGSFGRLLNSFKGVNANLVEEVSQVRRYRNWVAHGRKPEERRDFVNPQMAYDRLGRFLGLINAPAPGTADPF